MSNSRGVNIINYWPNSRLACQTRDTLCQNSWLSNIDSYKIAVVDVQKIVANSSQVRNLKAEQKRKIKDLQVFVINTQKAVAS